METSTAQATAPPTGGDATDNEPVDLFQAAAANAGTRGSRPATGGAASIFGAPGAGAAAGAGGDSPGGLGNLDWLRGNPQFQQLRQVVQQQPQMLEPILQSVGAGNPALAQLIGQHPEEFLQLLGEADDDDVPLPPGAQSISVTEEERDAIERVSLLLTFLLRIPLLTSMLALQTWL